MRSTTLAFAIAALFAGATHAQLQVGYVDSDAIMDEMPDAADARAALDRLVEEWQAELSAMENEWEKKYRDYEKRKLIMSDQRRAEVEKDLTELETEIIKYREEKFGSDGELFRKQDELMKPVQNRVFNAIEEIAIEEDLDFVFDRSGGVLMLYAKDEYDITPKVLRRLEEGGGMGDDERND